VTPRSAAKRAEQNVRREQPSDRIQAYPMKTLVRGVKRGSALRQHDCYDGRRGPVISKDTYGLI
jgi:hypothetical protein